MTIFRPIRTAALAYWAEQTGRELYNEQGIPLLTDSFSGAYECDWQLGYDDHVHLFCSLGDWACNLTDLLKDDRFDNYDLDNPEQAQVIFRFYTRLMLVISEMLTDFQDIYRHIKNLQQNQANNVARQFYFPRETPDRITKVLNFINHTCKHKTQHIHVCNNHMPFHFTDSLVRRPRRNYISLVDSRTAGKDAVLVPDLNYLIRTVLTCYRKLNNYFKMNKTDYRNLCSRFS